MNGNLHELGRHWAWFVTLGVVSILVGVLALTVPVAASISIAAFAGAMLVVLGVMQVVHSFKSRAGGRGTVRLIAGLVALLAGVLLLANPFAGALTLTALIALWIVFDGVMRVLIALEFRPARGWGFTLFTGILGMALGAMILAGWPLGGAWVPGAVFGVYLLFQGWSMVALGLAIRSAGQLEGGGGLHRTA